MRKNILTSNTRVLESLKANKRLPEAGFSNLHIAPKGQRSVMSMFAKKES